MVAFGTINQVLIPLAEETEEAFIQFVGFPFVVKSTCPEAYSTPEPPPPPPEALAKDNCPLPFV